MFAAWAFCLVFFVRSHHSDSAKEGAEVACSSAPFHLVASQGLDISQSAKTPTTSETTICSSLSRSNVSCGTLGIQPWTRRNGQLTVEVLGVQEAHQDEGGILSKLRGALDSYLRSFVCRAERASSIPKEGEITEIFQKDTMGSTDRHMGSTAMAAASNKEPSKRQRSYQGQGEWKRWQGKGQGKATGTYLDTTQRCHDQFICKQPPRDSRYGAIFKALCSTPAEAAGFATGSAECFASHPDRRHQDDHKATPQCSVAIGVSKEAAGHTGPGQNKSPSILDFFHQGVSGTMEEACRRFSRARCEDSQANRRGNQEAPSLTGELPAVSTQSRGSWEDRSDRIGDRRRAARACHECGKEPLGNGFKPRRNGREDGTGRACDQEKKDGRSKRSKGGKAWCSAIIMIFGRQVCAPFQTTCWGHAVPCWAHSALQMSDFLPPWKAIEDAVQLAWELGLSHPTVAREGQPRTPNTVHKTVSFEENVEIRFYSGSVAANSTIQHSILSAWSDKPWRLSNSQGTDGPDLDPHHPYASDSWCGGLEDSAHDPTCRLISSRVQPHQCYGRKRSPLLQSRLLDERNSASVSGCSGEQTHVEGLDRAGDPEDEQLVIIDGWQELLEVLHQHTPSPDYLIHLEMYGLHITHHSIRITDCEATIAAIREAVQQSWRDAMPPQSVAYIHLVRPQEHRHARAVVLQMIVEIVPFGVDIPPNDVPILRRIRWHSDHSMTLETAYMRDQQTGYELLFDAHLDEWCHPRHGVQCNLHIESRIALMAHRHHLLPGSLLEIFIHDDDRPGLSVSSQASSQHDDLQPGQHHLDVLQEWLVGCSCSHVSLVMYGLFGSSLGTRYAISQADYQQVRSAVLQEWQDYIQPDTSVALRMVRPQDEQHPDHLHVIVELTRPSQARPAGYLPILQRILWHNIWQGDTSAAVYRVPGQHMRPLLAASGLAEWCGPSTRAICRIQVERRHIPISEGIELQVGSLLEISVSLQHAEDDASSFLQGKHSLHTSSQVGTFVSVNHPHVSDRWCDDLPDLWPLPCYSSNHCLPFEPDSPDGSKDKVGPSILTYRPNAAITLEFDDFIPMRNGGRIIPPPNWRQNSLLRYASSNEAVFRDRHGFLTVDCRTWLLPHGDGGHRQPRDLRIQAQLLIHLTERIRHLWRDFVAPGDAIRVQHVRPTPLARGNQPQLPKLHLLVEVNRPLGDLSRPILMSFQQISAQGLSNEVDWLPSLSGDVVTLQSILQASSLACEARNLLVPLADRARGWLGTQQQRHVAPGAYIPIWWDLRWNADPEPVPATNTPVEPHDLDDLSLMQWPTDLGGQQERGDPEENAISLMQTRASSRSPRRATPLSTSSHDDEKPGTSAHLSHVSKLQEGGP